MKIKFPDGYLARTDLFHSVKWPSMGRKGWIYLLYNYETGYWKIGKTTACPKKRAKKIGSISGCRIELVWAFHNVCPTAMAFKIDEWELENPCIDWMEKYLHKKCKKYRIKGEWFDLPEDALEYVLSEFCLAADDVLSIGPYGDQELENFEWI